MALCELRRIIRPLLCLCLAVFLISSPALADEDRQGILKWPNRNFVIPVRPPPSNADPANPDGPEDVITQRNNNLRTGALVSRGLNQASLTDGHFGFLASLPVDGAVLSQPLFMESVQFPQGRRSAVFIATSTNWVYAFNTDPPFDKLWERNLGPPFRIDDPWNQNNTEGRNCAGLMITAEQDDRSFVVLGIDSTPVIAPKLNRLLVSYRSAADGPSGTQRIAALDVRTGKLAKGPDGRDLDHPITNDPILHVLHRNRASLLIDGDLVYVGYGSRCENDNPSLLPGLKYSSFQGWIYAFDIRTLAFAGRYRTTQEPVVGGGIWLASTGLAADGKGSLFFSTGNASQGIVAPPDAAGRNLSNSVVRLQVNRDTPQRGAITMTPSDWFTPYRKVWQDYIDLDFGSAGVMLIPNTRYLVAGGKEGLLYLLDRNNLGKFDNTPNFNRDSVLGKSLTSHDAPDDPNRDHVVQKIQVGINEYCFNAKKALFCSGKTPDGVTPRHDMSATGVTMDDWLPWPHIHGTPVFGAFPDGRAFLYIWPEKDHLKSFRWWGNSFDIDPMYATRLPSNEIRVLAPPYLQDVLAAVGMPGGMLSLTIDPSQPAGGVLFASVQRCRSAADDRARNECAISRCDSLENCREQRFGMLRAFDPITLRELWNNQMDPFGQDGDKDYWFSKYVPPTIAKGRVFLPTASKKVLVYGRR